MKTITQQFIEDLTLRQLQSSPVSDTTKGYADERGVLMGDNFRITQLITARYSETKDYILAKFLTEATQKYSDDHVYKDADPHSDFSLKYDPSETYELWIMFYPIRETLSLNGLQLDKEGIKKVLEACFVKVWSNSPSFHWQGFNYNLSQKRASLFPTKIKPTKWDKIHGKALMDKHLYATLKEISKYFEEIANKTVAAIEKTAPTEIPEVEETIYESSFRKMTMREEMNTQKDTAVFSIGRFNPYTKGHEKLVDKIIATAQSLRADAILFATHSQDAKKNPLSWEEKIAFLRKACGSKPITICDDPNVKSPFDAAMWIGGRGYKNMVAIFGSDRVTELETLYNKYNGKETDKGLYEFETIQVVSAGDRDPDSTDVEGFSATKARNAAVDNDFQTFFTIAGTTDESLAQEMFVAVKKGMNIAEAQFRIQLYTYLQETSGIPMRELRRTLREVSADELVSMYEERHKDVVLQEGGHAVLGDRIQKKDIEPTLDKFIPLLTKLIPGSNFLPIGSTGKKPDNGDIDLAFECSLSLDQISALFVAEGYQTAPNKGLGQVSVKFPQYDETGKEIGLSVQIDLMVGDLNWLKFMYMGYGPDETAYKPLARTACIYALLRFAAEEVQEDGSLLFYSISPNKGIFLKKGQLVGDKFTSEKVGAEIISDPEEVASLISVNSSEEWSVSDLIKPIEYILQKVSRSFSPELSKKIRQYVGDFLEKQGLEGPSGLRENTKKTSHLTHVEDLIYDEGVDGGIKALRYLDSLVSELQGKVPKHGKMKTTLKIDGSPSICIATSYPGIEGPFVGMKNTFSPKKPQIFQTTEEINARYGESPDLAKKLSVALEFAGQMSIPKGEVWKGDFLFTEEDVEIYTDESGEEWVTFQPNTLVYAIKADSDAGKKVLNSLIGIAFHTRYRGDDLRTAEQTATFDIDISELPQIPHTFFIDANLPSSEQSSSTEFEGKIEALENSLSNCAELADEIAENSTYNSLLNQFENYEVKQGRQFDDIEKYVDGLLEWVQGYYQKDSLTKKTPKGQQGSFDKATSVKKFFGEERRGEFISLLTFQKGIVELKGLLLRALNSSSPMSAHTRDGEGLKPTGHEGFAVSDVEGNIVKLVDRKEFSRMNLTKHTEKMNQEDMMNFLSDKGLDLKSQKKRREDNKIILVVQSATGEDRKAAADRVALETHLHSWSLGKRPVIDGPEIDPYVIEFKDVPGGGTDKRGDASRITAMQETATAYTFYKIVEEDIRPSLEEVQIIFPECDMSWYSSFIKSADAFKEWLGHERGYVYSRGTLSYPFSETDSVHGLIKYMAKSLGFRSADAWNPSDIYICKSDVIPSMSFFFNDLAESKEDQESKLLKVNDFLAEGLESKKIIGVSLKKISKNKEASVEDAGDLEGHKIPDLRLKAFPLKMGVQTLSVKLESSDGDYSIRLGSNNPSMMIPIIVEFQKKGSVAQLGKASGSPVVSEWFRKYGMEKPSGKDFKRWKILSEADIDSFFVKADLILATLPGTMFSLNEVEELFPADLEQDQNQKIYQNIKIQQLIYGELFSKVYRDGKMEEMLKDWFLAAKKNTVNSAPFIKVTDLF